MNAPNFITALKEATLALSLIIFRKKKKENKKQHNRLMKRSS